MRRMPLAAMLLTISAVEAQADTLEDVRNQDHWTQLKTEPTTWSTEGGFGLKWGMGTGDITDRYPGSYVQSDPIAQRVQNYFVDDTVEDMKVGLAFAFYNGCLYRVEVNSAALSSVLGSAPQPRPVEDRIEERKQSWRVAWRWRQRVYQALVAKHGKPLQAPGTEVSPEYCDKFPDTCGTAADDTQRVLRWLWRNGGTDILLTGGPAPKLEYFDRAINQKADTEKEMARREWRKAEGAKKEAARDRL